MTRNARPEIASRAGELLHPATWAIKPTPIARGTTVGHKMAEEVVRARKLDQHERELSGTDASQKHRPLNLIKAGVSLYETLRIQAKRMSRITRLTPCPSRLCTTERSQDIQVLNEGAPNES